MNRFGSVQEAQRALVPPIYRSSPTLIYDLQPKASTYMKSPYGDFEGSVTINSLGFRGREIERKKSKDRFRIVVIGDSFTFGLGVGDSLTYSAQLEKMMNVGDKNQFEVLNLGIPGYNLEQYYIVLNEKVLPLDPDFLLLGVFSWNDFKFEEWGKHRTREKDNLPEALASDHIVGPDGRLRVRNQKAQEPIPSRWNFFPEPIKRFFRKNVHLYYFIGERLSSLRIKPDVWSPPSEKKPHEFQESKKDIVSPGALANSKNRSDGRRFQIFSGMLKILKKQKIPWMVVFIPHRSEIHPTKKIEQLERKKLIRWLEMLQVPVLDLFIALQPFANFKNAPHFDLYNKWETHFNARGNQKVAELIYGRLKHLLPERRKIQIQQ